MINNQHNTHFFPYYCKTTADAFRQADIAAGKRDFRLKTEYGTFIKTEK